MNYIYFFIGMSLISFSLLYLLIVIKFYNNMKLHKYSMLMGAIGAVIVAQYMNTYYYYVYLIGALLAFTIFIQQCLVNE